MKQWAFVSIGHCGCVILQAYYVTGQLQKHGDGGGGDGDSGVMVVVLGDSGGGGDGGWQLSCHGLATSLGGGGDGGGGGLYTPPQILLDSDGSLIRLSEFSGSPVGVEWD